MRRSVRNVLFMGVLGLIGQALCFAQQVPLEPGPTLLVDTDWECQVTVDGKDMGALTPTNPATFPIATGEHIVKAFVKGNPDLQWRKVVDVNANKQFVVAIELREAAQPKQPAAPNPSKTPTSEKAGTEAEPASGGAIPTTGKYFGTAAAGDFERDYGNDKDLVPCPETGCAIAGEGRTYTGNIADFTLDLAGRSGDYIQATVQMSGKNYEQWINKGHASFAIDNRTNTLFRLLLAQSTKDPKVLEVHTCTKESASASRRTYLDNLNEPPDVYNGDRETATCLGLPIEGFKFILEDETKVSFTATVWIASWGYPFKGTLIKTF